MTAIEKVRCLEKYLAISGAAIDPVPDMGISKLFDREIFRMSNLRQTLSKQISEFENCYSINSAEFYRRYEKGDMGDDMDFIERASTIEMIGNIDKNLLLLKSEIS